MKTAGTILLAIGILMLISGILYTFAIGGGISLALLIGSVLLNSAGIMLLRGK